MEVSSLEVWSTCFSRWTRIERPIAKVNINTPYFVREVIAWCVTDPVYPLMGNIQHAGDLNEPDKDWKPSCVNAVVTRQQERNSLF